MANFDSGKGLVSNNIRSIYETFDENGKQILWIGTRDGLSRFDGESFQNFDESNGLPKKTVRSIIETADKSLFIGTTDGIAVWKGNEKRIFNKDNGFPFKTVFTLLETKNQVGESIVWAGTDGGLAKFEDEKFTVFNTNNGLPNNRIYSLAEIKDDSARQLWIGTGGGGVAILNLDSTETTFQKISTETSNLLPNDSILQIFQDANKRIYLTTNKGVARFTNLGKLSELNFQSYIFTTEDGLPSNECISGAGFLDAKGNVWVGTVGGAVMLDLSKEFSDTTPDTIFLEKILVDGKERKFATKPELPYNQNNLVFQ